jgi:flagellar biosynthetic protein FliQ
MGPDQVLALIRQGLEVGLMVSAPLLGAALVTGLVVGIFQAATQVNEMTLSFIPKLAAIFVALVVAGPWMLAVLVDFMRRLLTELPHLIG